MTKKSSIARWTAAALGLLLAGTAPGLAQPKHHLYIGYWNSKGYVVGAKLNQSGLHRWNGDTTWVHLGWNTPRISGISINPQNTDEIFLASGNGVIRSRDAGQTWKVVTDWQVTEVQDVSVHPLNPRQVWAASGYGIFGTADGGETWAEMNQGLGRPGNNYTQTVEADRTTRDRVFAGGWEGLFESTNGGRQWRRVAAEGHPVLDIQQSIANPERWIFTTEKAGIWLSNDNGKSWSQVKGKSAGMTFYAAAVDPHNPDRMAAGGWNTGVWVTANGGRSWTNLTKGLPNLNIYEVIYDADVPGRLWVATIEGGLFHTVDQGKTWQQAGLGTSTIFDMQFAEVK